MAHFEQIGNSSQQRLRIRRCCAASFSSSLTSSPPSFDDDDDHHHVVLIKIVKIAEHELIRKHGHSTFKEAYDRAVEEARKIKSYESQSEEENAVDLKGIRMRDAFSKLKELEGNQATFPELMEQAMKGAKERAKLMSASEMEMRGWRHGERWF